MVAAPTSSPSKSKSAPQSPAGLPIASQPQQECESAMACVLDQLHPNVGNTERLLSIAVGAGVAAYGLTSVHRGRIPLAAVGTALILRGLAGWCGLYKLVGMDTTCDRD